jgi:hypothetical protein
MLLRIRGSVSGVWSGHSTSSLLSGTLSRQTTYENHSAVLFQLTLTYLQKLRPFFPPLEPLQSLNLRAAVFRCLSDLKKNGTLGREVTLRKTMLDDCKGEKFEELLASFSTVVLRKVASGRAPTYIAGRLSLKTALTKEEEQLLVPLIISHHASIEKSLRGRSDRQETFRSLHKLLELKEFELDRRSEELANPENVAPNLFAERVRLREALNDQWQGDSRWADIIINGVRERPGDTFLQLPFDKFLGRVLSGTAADGELPSLGNVLTELDAKIAEQKGRLQKWKEFQASWEVKKEEAQPERTSSSSKQSDSALVFQEHRLLHVGSDTTETNHASSPTSAYPDVEYDDIISSMHRELSKFKADSFKPKKPLKAAGRAKMGHPRVAPTPAMDEASDSVTVASSMSHIRPDISLPSGVNLVPADKVRSPPDTHKPTLAAMRSIGEDNLSVQDNNSSPKDPTPLPINPPPTKSLNPPSSSPVRTTLLERTRQSMSLLPNPNPNPNPRSHPMNPPKAPRPSSTAFPVNPFETPPKREKARRHSTQSPLASGESTPKEELFSQDADYASVFKSRPRVALSPDPSPSVRWRS